MEKRIRALIDQNQKVQAIKLVHQITGWGLKESKDYVDTLARAARPALDAADEAALEQKVKALVRQDRYAEAVKYVREQTGWGLGDCKAHVDMLVKGSVDSLESKKKRHRKRRRKRSRTRPANRLQVGDSVVVKPEGVDLDLDVDIGGWCGRVAEEPDTADMILINWDSITLQNVPDSMIVQCEEQGLVDWTGMVLSVQDVEPTSPRDSKADVVQIVEELSKKYAWVYLGEEGQRINQVLAGVDPDDEMAIVETWEGHLQKNLAFPFEAEVDEYQDRGPLRTGDRVTVRGIVDVDDHYGVIVRLRCRRRQYDFPLCDLEVTDKHSPNFQVVRDYVVWFANR